MTASAGAAMNCFIGVHMVPKKPVPHISLLRCGWGVGETYCKTALPTRWRASARISC